MGRLDGRVAIVTGGGRGIGRGTAELLAHEGASVVVATRTADAGQETVDAIVGAGGTAILETTDVGRSEAVKALVEATVARFGRIDIVVHNAAFLHRSPLADMSDDALDQMFDVGVKAAFWLTREALPWLEKSPAGRILITSSVAGNRVSLLHQVHYGAAKMAVTGFVRGAALELAGKGITVNAIEPGLTQTAALERAMTPQQIAAMSAKIPLGRAALPADIAAAFLFFASDDASHVTGQTLTIDGGSSLGDVAPLAKKE